LRGDTNSPYAAGGGGTHLEARVAASALVAILCEAPLRGLLGNFATCVRTQRANFGDPLDDIVVTGRGDALRSCECGVSCKVSMMDGNARGEVRGRWFRLSDSTILTFACFSCLVAGWWAEEAFRMLPSPAICFDLRKDRAENRRFVLVSSRDSDLVGHAFVSWIQNPPDNGPQDVRMWGFYQLPGNHYEAILAGPGQMLDEKHELDVIAAAGLLSRWETRTAIVFWVDQDEFEASYAVIKSASTPGQAYALLSNDCVTAVARILEHFGRRPGSFVGALWGRRSGCLR